LNINVKRKYSITFYKYGGELSIQPIELYQGDCLQVMDELIIKNTKVDAIICDLPYGTTKCKWDNVIDFSEMWKRITSIRKDSTPIILFGSEPFSSMLRMSNMNEYKYDWYLKKSRPQGFANAKKMPLKDIETISVFYKKQPTYNPQGIRIINKLIRNSKSKKKNELHVSSQNGGSMKKDKYLQKYTNYPRQIIETSVVINPVHPTQKPLELLEYLIKTYSNEEDIVLDFTMGSGTTGVACKNTNRRFIGIELDEEHFKIAKNRI
jgi:site-specific DNA-methyltransferase (adenine-specific)